MLFRSVNDQRDYEDAASLGARQHATRIWVRVTCARAGCCLRRVAAPSLVAVGAVGALPDSDSRCCFGRSLTSVHERTAWTHAWFGSGGRTRLVREWREDCPWVGTIVAPAVGATESLGSLCWRDPQAPSYVQNEMAACAYMPKNLGCTSRVLSLHGSSTWSARRPG